MREKNILQQLTGRPFIVQLKIHLWTQNRFTLCLSIACTALLAA